MEALLHSPLFAAGLAARAGVTAPEPRAGGPVVGDHAQGGRDKSSWGVNVTTGAASGSGAGSSLGSGVSVSAGASVVGCEVAGGFSVVAGASLPRTPLTTKIEAMIATTTPPPTISHGRA